MVRQDFEKLAKIGERFIKYLSEQNILRTYPKPELKLHFENFKRNNGITSASYSSTLWVLARITRKLKVQNGYVVFKDTAEWNNRLDQIACIFTC